MLISLSKATCYCRPRSHMVKRWGASTVDGDCSTILRLEFHSNWKRWECNKWGNIKSGIWFKAKVIYSNILYADLKRPFTWFRHFSALRCWGGIKKRYWCPTTTFEQHLQGHMDIITSILFYQGGQTRLATNTMVTNTNLHPNMQKRHIALTIRKTILVFYNIPTF